MKTFTLVLVSAAFAAGAAYACPYGSKQEAKTPTITADTTILPKPKSGS